MKRILLSAESSLLNTGYGTMTMEIARRLHARGYAVAELASYLSEDDPRLGQIPWKVYPVRPAQSNQEATRQYNADPYNQFGKAIFERAVLDFKADVCIGWRDAWYEQHITISPLRRFFRFLYMPTCDSTPQKAEWVGQFANADALFSYTDWAREVLEGYGLNVLSSTPPGVDHQAFRPMDRNGLRAECRIPDRALVVGFVARNQPRKRFPELARAFSRFLRTAPEDLAERVYLYWHTAWPDLGWDIPGLLHEFGISSRVLFTYVCRNCKTLVPSLWSDAVRPCPNCGRMDAVLPGTGAGLSHADMAKVYNLMDLYVQYSNSEGLGMSLPEAASCGVSVMAADYSGMACVVRKLGGVPLKVAAFYREPELGLDKAIPDEEDFCQKLTDFLRKPEPVRRMLGGRARDAAVRHYDWDALVENWVRAIEGMPPAAPYDEPPTYHMPQPLQEGLSNADFVRQGLTRVAGRPDLVDSWYAQRLLRELNWGATLTGSPHWLRDDSWMGRHQEVREVNRDVLLQVFRNLNHERNFWEQERTR